MLTLFLLPQVHALRRTGIWRPWRRGEEKLHVALGVLHQQSRQLLGTVEVTILCARGVFLAAEGLWQVVFHGSLALGIVKVLAHAGTQGAAIAAAVLLLHRLHALHAVGLPTELLQILVVRRLKCLDGLLLGGFNEAGVLQLRRQRVIHILQRLQQTPSGKGSPAFWIEDLATLGMQSRGNLGRCNTVLGGVQDLLAVGFDPRQSPIQYRISCHRGGKGTDDSESKHGSGNQPSSISSGCGHNNIHQSQSP
mmetsp:Transcript_53496/g.116853  ORF Transcript_53496/g.116853 Transcript_53496/m.116853 type:complete len:251 (+) Transcript_53496:305-1057(+)